MEITEDEMKDIIWRIANKLQENTPTSHMYLSTGRMIELINQAIDDWENYNEEVGNNK